MSAPVIDRTTVRAVLTSAVAAYPSEPTRVRCALAPAEDAHHCVGDLDAVVVGVWRTQLEKLAGCVLHAGLMLATEPPSKVFLTCTPPGRASYALAALELSRLIGHGEAGNLVEAAQEMRIVYVGLPPW